MLNMSKIKLNQFKSKRGFIDTHGKVHLYPKNINRTTFNMTIFYMYNVCINTEQNKHRGFLR